ncbi:MAG: dihydroxy-acid dehydratase, partial [Rhodobacteraceae bacterium]|nr:dihydroxy-acid dehydratase [Paracoccaceae bacterium]
DFHHRIDDPAENIDPSCILFMRGAGPKGYPGGAEVVNMRPPSYLLKQGVEALPCIGDGRQSGTSGSPSILNASPEAADGGGLALLRTGDMVRIDLNTCTANMLVEFDELADRAAKLAAEGGYPAPESQSPWQEIFREKVGRFDQGMTLNGADAYQDISRRYMPRDNH